MDEKKLAVPNSLAEVAERLRNDPALDKRKRQNMLWAVRRAEKVWHRPLADITANPSVLSNHLRSLNPASAGMGSGGWSNFRSLLRQALSHTGCYVHPGRHRTPLSPDWGALHARLENKNLKYGLSRFLHHASNCGWDPSDIRTESFVDYHHELEHHAICRNPARTVRQTMLLWNQAVRGVPGWPQRLVEVPRRNEGYCLQWGQFPETLEAQIDAYLTFRTDDTVLDESDLKQLSAGSAKRQKFCLRQLASALVRRGAAPDTLQHLSDVVRGERLKEGLRFFLERSGGAKTSQITNIANAALGAARYLARPEIGELNEEQVRSVHYWYKRVEHRPTGMTETNRERLRQFADRRNLRKLLFLPSDLVKRVSSRTPTVRDAQTVRTALAIELWLMFPIRRKNMARLHLDRHFRWTDTPDHPRLFVVIPAAEVKNNETLETELLQETQELLRLYVEVYRPLLVDEPNDWLFPAHKGDGHQNITGFGEYVTRVIRRETGLDLNPHLFRHLAAKLYLDANPGHLELVRRLLGHKDVKTTAAFYAEMDSLVAGRLYDECVLRLRNELAPLPDLDLREDVL